jgi:hypothetical protein
MISERDQEPFAVEQAAIKSIAIKRRFGCAASSVCGARDDESVGRLGMFEMPFVILLKVIGRANSDGLY